MQIMQFIDLRYKFQIKRGQKRGQLLSQNVYASLTNNNGNGFAVSQRTTDL